MASMLAAEALKAIETNLATPPAEITRELDGLAAQWLAGDIDGIAARTRSVFHDPEFSGPLLHDRNITFADAVAKLAQGHTTAMVIVGVAHMAGDDGVPAPLRQRGLDVERLP